MFEIYLLNLYKNLDFYNIKNIHKYSEFYKNKIHNMTGGNNDVNLEKIRELSDKIKNDMKELKKKFLESNKDTDYIKIKKEKFQLIKDLIEMSTQEILRDHEIVKKDIDKMYDAVQSEKFKKIQKNIDEINSMFAELLA